MNRPAKFVLNHKRTNERIEVRVTFIAGHTGVNARVVTPDSDWEAYFCTELLPPNPAVAAAAAITADEFQSEIVPVRVAPPVAALPAIAVRTAALVKPVAGKRRKIEGPAQKAAAATSGPFTVTDVCKICGFAAGHRGAVREAIKKLVVAGHVRVVNTNPDTKTITYERVTAKKAATPTRRNGYGNFNVAGAFSEFVGTIDKVFTKQDFIDLHKLKKDRLNSLDTALSAMKMDGKVEQLTPKIGSTLATYRAVG